MLALRGLARQWRSSELRLVRCEQLVLLGRTQIYFLEVDGTSIGVAVVIMDLICIFVRHLDRSAGSISDLVTLLLSPLLSEGAGGEPLFHAGAGILEVERELAANADGKRLLALLSDLLREGRAGGGA